jgi:hypothetical protein
MKKIVHKIEEQRVLEGKMKKSMKDLRKRNVKFLCVIGLLIIGKLSDNKTTLLCVSGFQPIKLYEPTNT